VTPPPPFCRLRRDRLADCGALVRAIDGGAPRLATRLALLDDGERLHVRFECEAPAPWATHRQRDAPLWEEEVVEVFVAPGEPTPRRYFELELNPLGAVFDAAVDNPHGDRREMRVDSGWDCPQLETRCEIDAARGLWRAELALPWRALGDAREKRWRLNAFRIERPRGGEPEFCAWSPTFARPADFHRPARFGFVTRIE
jgi:hypothetical protein